MFYTCNNVVKEEDNFIMIHHACGVSKSKIFAVVDSYLETHYIHCKTVTSSSTVLLLCGSYFRVALEFVGTQGGLFDIFVFQVCFDEQV